MQGLVNLLPMDRSCGGNVLIPKSHKDFPNIATKYPERVAKVPANIDHFRYPPNDPLLVEGAEEKPIMCHLEVGETTKCIDECSKALDEIGDVAEERALAFKVRLRRADARYRLGMKEEARGDLVVLKKTAAGKAEKVALEILEKLIDAEVVLD